MINVKSMFSGVKVNQVRNILTPYWKSLLVISLVLVGLTLFLGAEYGLANLIIGDKYLLGVGVLIAIAILFVTVAYPFWGYALWFFLSCYLALFGSVLPAMFSFDLIMLSLLALVLLVKALCKKELSIKFSVEECFLIMFFIYGYIIRRDFDTSHMVAELKIFFLSPLCFYFIAKNIIKDKKQIYWLMMVIIITGVSFALMGIYEQITGKMWLAGLMGGDRGLYGGMRSTGPAGHYYVYGNMLIVTILLCLHLLLWRRALYSKLLLIACMLVSVIGLYYGFSRAPYGAFVLSIFAMLLLAKRSKKVYIVFAAISVLVAIVIIPTITESSKIQNRFKEGVAIDRGRIATDMTSLNMFKANYLFGVGKDKYQVFVSDYVSSMAHNSMKSSPNGLIIYWGKPHSEYYLMLTELGIVGFLLYFCTYLLFLRKFIRLRALLPSDVVGCDFAVIAIAFTLGVFLTMYTDEFSFNPYMYAILFTIYAMLTKSEYLALKKKA